MSLTREWDNSLKYQVMHLKLCGQLLTKSWSGTERLLSFTEDITSNIALQPLTFPDLGRYLQLTYCRSGWLTLPIAYICPPKYFYVVLQDLQNRFSGISRFPKCFQSSSWVPLFIFKWGLFASQVAQETERRGSCNNSSTASSGNRWEVCFLFAKVFLEC